MAVSHTAVAGVERGGRRSRRRDFSGLAPEAGVARLRRTADPVNPGLPEREDPAWPVAAQVWNWAEGVVLFGHGPGASAFL
jgi:hypothetical protein